MKKVVYSKVVPVSVEEAYNRIADFKSFERYCESVISVDVDEKSDAESESTWRVHFHDGQMCWKERDVFDPSNHTIDFEQLEGDAEQFEGKWVVTKDEYDQTKVTFEALFCMGIPTLADILEPIAESAIKDNIEAMLSQLFVAEEIAQ